QIAEALARADSLDLAVVAIGGWTPQSSTVYPTLSAADRAAIEAHAVAGECSGRLFDADGLELHAPLEQRAVAVHPDQLRRAPAAPHGLPEAVGAGPGGDGGTCGGR